jgi:dolichyl-diphosphooligosaccharide--protein glycosyltransferase
MFVAVFAGLSIVYVLARAGSINPPAQMTENTSRELGVSRPSFRHAVVLLLVLGAATGYGAAQSVDKTSSSAVTDGAYRTASFAAQHAAVSETEYPQNYVLSRWGRARMYNYLVSGESRSYGFAQSTYVDFMSSISPESDGWDERFEGRVGYVVVDPSVTADGPFVYTRLQSHYGSRYDDVGGLGHYRLLYETDTPEGPYQLFEFVPGATINGSLDTTRPFLVSTEVSVNQTAFEYQRRVVPTDAGQFDITVAYPGVYEIAGRNVTVSEAAVANGRSVTVE